MPDVRVVDLALLSYAEAYERQLQAVRQVQTGEGAETLFLVEHPDVYTSGRKESTAALAFASPSVPIVAIERGGRITFHNPGQMVAYPILRLQGPERDLHRYLRNLEIALIETLSSFGIRGESRKNETGVWISGASRKIASIGIAVRGWVTFHGIALNVKNDLSGFLKVSPCGYSGEVMTSIHRELGDNGPSLATVKQVFCDQFGRVFGRTLQSASAATA